MPIELPSNVKLMWEGTITVTIFRDRLWPDLPRISEGAVDPGTLDKIASSIKFAELWKSELARRQKRSILHFKTAPGENYAHVETSPDHANPEAMNDTLRVGQEVFARWQEWCVALGSEEANAIRKAYAAKVTYLKPEETPTHDV